MAVTGILGGVFDPPHDGHVALARAAVTELGLERLLVLVVADPGHKHAATPAETRLVLAKTAFAGVPEATVELDGHSRTVDSLEARRLPADTFFVLGADELAGFEDWKAPRRVLELVRIAVAMRPGISREQVDAVRQRLDADGRILEFDLEPLPISSSEIRERVARQQPIDDLVPPAVADEIARLGLYATHE
jgi:nicotinate-nucleotide adenylyltransferase